MVVSTWPRPRDELLRKTSPRSPASSPIRRAYVGASNNRSSRPNLLFGVQDRSLEVLDPLREIGVPVAELLQFSLVRC
eukprot:2822925-Pyramimonas_sp.AAC.1